MSRRLEVVWAKSAENDLKDIIEYIAADNPSDALKKFNHLKQKASSLFTFPERGRIVPELRDHGILQYRELIFPPWRILYRISFKQVYVLAVIDSRRNIEDVLLTRLIHSIT